MSDIMNSNKKLMAITTIALLILFCAGIYYYMQQINTEAQQANQELDKEAAEMQQSKLKALNTGIFENQQYENLEMQYDPKDASTTYAELEIEDKIGNQSPFVSEPKKK